MTSNYKTTFTTEDGQCNTVSYITNECMIEKRIISRLFDSETTMIGFDLVENGTMLLFSSMYEEQDGTHYDVSCTLHNVSNELKTELNKF